jgi:hypothetical protein
MQNTFYKERGKYHLMLFVVLFFLQVNKRFWVFNIIINAEHAYQNKKRENNYDDHLMIHEILVMIIFYQTEVTVLQLQLFIYAQFQ